MSKRTKPPHRYFFYRSETETPRVIVFKNGSEKKGTAHFEDGSGNAWWNVGEMRTLGAIEIPAKLLKKVACL